jgi:serine/threonine protein kinase
MENNTTNSFRELAAGVMLNGGKYVIERMIGAGGFGITYKARQSGLDRTVAVKEFFMNGYCIRNTQAKTVILQGMTENTFEKYRQKFVDEARLLAKLKHPNIVEVIDVFDENGTSYMVMPFIEGQTLQKLVETQKTLNYALTVNYLSQVASAVEYIHQQNILHRDIKPDNIIITPGHHAILIDFGSAREFINDKTQAHTSMLTQGYAPLEQYDTVSRKGSYTDIYALGAVFFFALTGQKPMDATTRIMEKMPDPKTLNPDISEDVNRTILKAMAMKPANRHQSIDEFMADMLGQKPSKPIIETPEKVIVKIKSSRKWIWILLASLIAGGAVTGALIHNHIEKQKETERIIAQKNEIIAQSKVVNDSIALTTVFWSDGYDNYCLFKDCPHLVKSAIMEGTVEEAFEYDKKNLCPECLNRVAIYKEYRKNAGDYYAAARDMQDKEFFGYALDYCNKALAMRPDNKRINTMKQEIMKHEIMEER